MNRWAGETQSITRSFASPPEVNKKMDLLLVTDKNGLSLELAYFRNLNVYSATPSLFYRYFSYSLIICQEKTKKITTVTVVCICVPTYHKNCYLLPLISPRVIDHLRSHQISKYLEVGLASFSQPTSQCLDI